MDFLISDTFTDSLARLTGDEQKAAKTTAFDLQINPSSPGLSYHKLDRPRDKNFWSVRVNQDVRLIVHKTDASLLLCYVDHHDKAYDWAARRKLETHPNTGAAQLVEIRETVQEIVIPTYIEAPIPTPPRAPLLLFANHPDSELLAYGVPAEWLTNVRAATEDTLFAVAEHLPAEAAEALLELATGGRPRLPELAVPGIDPLNHPDAQRRFRVIASAEELQRALDYPWDKWTIYLHPEQRQWVERDYNGPARVSGSAGTGKTIVALHRAVHLARTNPDSRVLVTTFSDILASDLKTRINRLVAHEPKLAERLDVYSMNAIGKRLYRSHFGPPDFATVEVVSELLADASAKAGGHKFSLHFLHTEWDFVVDAWQLTTWESYRDVVRLGRRTRLAEPQREILWSIFSDVRANLEKRNLTTHAQMFMRLADEMTKSGKTPFEFAIVDEAQDLTVAQLRFFAALGAGRPDALFFAGDLGQRIFQHPFSWLSLGVDVRGRSRTLKINYRTSHQIRIQADRLLGPEIADVDGNVESRTDTISVFDGPPPAILTCSDGAAETLAVSGWISDRLGDGVAADAIAVFVRSEAELSRAIAAVDGAGLPYMILTDTSERREGTVSISTMHHAKGLEFRAVAVIACDDEIVPSQARIESVGDDSELKEVYDTERHLLYVACTRARDFLLITGVEPSSEFLDDLRTR